MKLPRKIALPLLLVAALSSAACSSSRPTPPAGPAPSSAVPSPSPSPSPLRTIAVGQPFDVPGWRITVTGMTCGVSGNSGLAENPADQVCVVHLSYVNTGTSPAWFTGQAAGGTAMPTDDARGFDVQGRTYDFSRMARGEVNPGGSDTTDLRFAVAPGVRLVRLEMADVAVAL